jgi:hypothetical protein
MSIARPSSTRGATAHQPDSTWFQPAGADLSLAWCPSNIAVAYFYACRLLQAVPEAQITIYASKFGSDVTTHGAAGVWMPYKLSETPEVLTDRCALCSHSECRTLNLVPLRGTAARLCSAVAEHRALLTF